MSYFENIKNFYKQKSNEFLIEKILDSGYSLKDNLKSNKSYYKKDGLYFFKDYDNYREVYFDEILEQFENVIDTKNNYYKFIYKEENGMIYSIDSNEGFIIPLEDINYDLSESNIGSSYIQIKNENNHYLIIPYLSQIEKSNSFYSDEEKFENKPYYLNQGDLIGLKDKNIGSIILKLNDKNIDLNNNEKIDLDKLKELIYLKNEFNENLDTEIFTNKKSFSLFKTLYISNLNNNNKFNNLNNQVYYNPYTSLRFGVNGEQKQEFILKIELTDLEYILETLKTNNINYSESLDENFVEIKFDNFLDFINNTEIVLERCDEIYSKNKNHDINFYEYLLEKHFNEILNEHEFEIIKKNLKDYPIKDNLSSIEELFNLYQEEINMENIISLYLNKDFKNDIHLKNISTEEKITNNDLFKIKFEEFFMNDSEFSIDLNFYKEVLNEYTEHIDKKSLILEYLKSSNSFIYESQELKKLKNITKDLKDNKIIDKEIDLLLLNYLSKKENNQEITDIIYSENIDNFKTFLLNRFVTQEEKLNNVLMNLDKDKKIKINNSTYITSDIVENQKTFKIITLDDFYNEKDSPLFNIDELKNKLYEDFKNKDFSKFNKNDSNKFINNDLNKFINNDLNKFINKYYNNNNSSLLKDNVKVISDIRNKEKQTYNGYNDTEKYLEAIANGKVCLLKKITNIQNEAEFYLIKEEDGKIYKQSVYKLDDIKLEEINRNYLNDKNKFKIETEVLSLENTKEFLDLYTGSDMQVFLKDYDYRINNFINKDEESIKTFSKIIKNTSLIDLESKKEDLLNKIYEITKQESVNSPAIFSCIDKETGTVKLYKFEKNDENNIDLKMIIIPKNGLNPYSLNYKNALVEAKEYKKNYNGEEQEFTVLKTKCNNNMFKLLMNELILIDDQRDILRNEFVKNNDNNLAIDFNENFETLYQGVNFDSEIKIINNLNINDLSNEKAYSFINENLDVINKLSKHYIGNYKEDEFPLEDLQEKTSNYINLLSNINKTLKIDNINSLYNSLNYSLLNKSNTNSIERMKESEVLITTELMEPNEIIKLNNLLNKTNISPNEVYEYDKTNNEKSNTTSIEKESLSSDEQFNEYMERERQIFSMER